MDKFTIAFVLSFIKQNNKFELIQSSILIPDKKDHTLQTA